MKRESMIQIMICTVCAPVGHEPLRDLRQGSTKKRENGTTLLQKITMEQAGEGGFLDELILFSFILVTSGVGYLDDFLFVSYFTRF